MNNVLLWDFLEYRKTETAKAIETKAWSEGKELDGKNLWSNELLEEFEIKSKNTNGLDLIKKVWIQILIRAEIKVTKKIHKEAFFIISFL